MDLMGFTPVASFLPSYIHLAARTAPPHQVRSRRQVGRKRSRSGGGQHKSPTHPKQPREFIHVIVGMCLVEGPCPCILFIILPFPSHHLSLSLSPPPHPHTHTHTHTSLSLLSVHDAAPPSPISAPRRELVSSVLLTRRVFYLFCRSFRSSRSSWYSECHKLRHLRTEVLVGPPQCPAVCFISNWK